MRRRPDVPDPDAPWARYGYKSAEEYAEVCQKRRERRERLMAMIELERGGA